MIHLKAPPSAVAFMYSASLIRNCPERAHLCTQLIWVKITWNILCTTERREMRLVLISVPIIILLGREGGWGVGGNNPWVDMRSSHDCRSGKSGRHKRSHVHLSSCRQGGEGGEQYYQSILLLHKCWIVNFCLYFYDIRCPSLII